MLRDASESSEEGIPLELNQPRSSPNRRRFLLAAGSAVASLAALGTLGYWQRNRVRGVLTTMGIGPLATMQAEWEAERAPLASEYLRTGELPPEDVRRRLYLRRDWSHYLGREFDETVRPFQDFEREQYEPFCNYVFERYRAQRLEHRETVRDFLESPTLEALSDLKAAFHEQAGHTYNRDNATVIDPVLQQRLQCKSGTRSFLLLAERLHAQEKLLQEGETLVEVYTNGHVHPGLLLPNGRLIAFEMTTNGEGYKDFGVMKAIDQPIQVVRADHAMFQSALGVRAFGETVVLHDTVPPEMAAVPRGLSLTGGGVALSGGKAVNTDWVGFGSAQVDEGDKDMLGIDYIPAQSSWSEAGPYDAMREEPSDKELLGRVTDPHDRAILRELFRHQDVIHQYWIRHGMILNPILEHPERYQLADVLEAVRKCGDVLDELHVYIERNDLERKHREAERIVRSYDLEIVIKSPVEQSDAIKHNAEVAADRWLEARGRR